MVVEREGMLEPSFLKSEKVGKGLYKLLIGKAENDVCGENRALMKKGLRRTPCLTS